jgi:S1-C subfamily serine protease
MHEGNSGGPVVSTTTGQIIGIVAERFSPTGSTPAVSIGDFGLGMESTISFAIPIEYALPLLKEDGVNV